MKSLDTHVFNWVKKYKLYGASAFDDKERNRNYSKRFKESVVKEYLLGKGSLKELAKRISKSIQYSFKYNFKKLGYEV